MVAAMSWLYQTCVVVGSIPPRLHLGHALVEQSEWSMCCCGRTGVCELGCPFGVVLVTFLPAQHFFPPSFVMSPLLCKSEVITVVLVKLQVGVRVKLQP